MLKFGLLLIGTFLYYKACGIIPVVRQRNIVPHLNLISALERHISKSDDPQRTRHQNSTKIGPRSMSGRITAEDEGPLPRNWAGVHQMPSPNDQCCLMIWGEQITLFTRYSSWSNRQTISADTLAS
jgi:hypothetical protein